MNAELTAIWTEYAAAPGRSEWRAAAVYLRESKREQETGFSPSAQLKGTLEEATRRQLWVPSDFVFMDLMSGRREDRAAFQDVLALARSGKIAAVIVLHTSRWSRNAMVSRKYKEELRQRGVEVIATNAPFDVARPEGKFAERLIEAADELTSDTIGWWVKIGLREKHERGEPLGKLPETFFRDAAGVVAPHPELSKIVLEGARKYVTGRVGFGDLALWSLQSGYRTPKGRALTDEWWRNQLANPLNAGYVGYHRKRGISELRRSTVDGFIPLELFQRVQEVRHVRNRQPKRSPNRRVYVLTPVAKCATCGGQVTASTKQRLRCRTAAQHAGCVEASVKAEHAETQIGDWIKGAFVLPSALRPRLAALVRAKVSGGRDASNAGEVRGRMKRLTDAYVYGGTPEADYREQLAILHTDLARVERAPDERRIMAAIKIAQDFGVAWDVAKPERRRDLLAVLFESVKIAGGAIVAVRPKAEVAPLLAVKVQSGGPDRIRTGDLVLDRDVC